ncbi:CUB domain-containing protein-like [Mizuhopecten yessoensis]|nr:CUB domain-containing protein-like [Mizuhopecten yessoensis]
MPTTTTSTTTTPAATTSTTTAPTTSTPTTAIPTTTPPTTPRPRPDCNNMFNLLGNYPSASYGWTWLDKLYCFVSRSRLLTFGRDYFRSLGDNARLYQRRWERSRSYGRRRNGYRRRRMFESSGEK